MSMLLCCGAEGLLCRRDCWQALSCPLPAPSLMCPGGDHWAILDNSEHLLWMEDHLFSVDSGIERLLLWQGRPLLLSGDTDCLSLLEPAGGNPLFLAPAGVYPQDMCLLPGNAVAVCGGGSGTVLVFSLPELRLMHTIPLPGSPQRIACLGKWLYVLCATEDDGLRTLLCRADPHARRYEPLATLPGLPGALYIDPRGLWVAVSETLYRFTPGERTPAFRLDRLGLVRHITGQQGTLLLSDQLLGTLFLLQPGRPLRPLKEGDVGQTAFL